MKAGRQYEHSGGQNNPEKTLIKNIGCWQGWQIFRSRKEAHFLETHTTNDGTEN